MSHPYLNMLLARARTDGLYKDAAAARRGVEAQRTTKARPSARARGHRRSGLSTELATPEHAVTLRRYSADDHDPLARLAALDSSKPPHQPVVVAEVGSELRAALSLNDGSLAADRFHVTEGVADLLRACPRQLDVQLETRARADSCGSSPDMCALKAGCRDVHPISRS